MILHIFITYYILHESLLNLFVKIVITCKSYLERRSKLNKKEETERLLYYQEDILPLINWQAALI